MIGPWIAGWLGGVVIGVVNGALRETTYGRRVGERTAQNISGVTGVAAWGAWFWALNRRWPIRDDREAAIIGAAWAAMTVVFEFGLGRTVQKQSWDEMLAAYDVTEGNTWPFVLAWIATGPAVVRRLQAAR